MNELSKSPESPLPHNGGIAKCADILEGRVNDLNILCSRIRTIKVRMLSQGEEVGDASPREGASSLPGRLFNVASEQGAIIDEANAVLGEIEEILGLTQDGVLQSG